jgi:hypothetical protein
MTDAKPTVVIYSDFDGNTCVFADPGVDVFWVDEVTPEDRTYQMSPGPIPESLVDETVGHKDDGSPASRKARTLERRIEGKPMFDVVGQKTPEDQP